MDPDARKGRVADVALGRIHSTGFALTTLEDIARAADVEEAEVRALFGDKEGLMQELVSPLLDRLRAVAAVAATTDLRRAKQMRGVIEGYLDALLAHRVLVGVILGDPTTASSESVCAVRDTIAGLRDQLASGIGPGLDHTIRAASALGAVQAAVLELTDFDPATVRDVITDAATAMLLP